MEILNETNLEPTKINYWKYSTFLFLIILLVEGIFVSNLINKQRSSPADDGSRGIITNNPNPTGIPSANEENSEIPIRKFSDSADGEAFISSNDLNNQKSFLLTLRSYSPDAITQIYLEKKFKVSLSGMDYVSDPIISYSEKFGCVKVGASGYWGYYIFSLPDGNRIDQGEQYSQCIEWIDDHQVIIAEHIYNTFDYSYYIFDANTKTKKILSSFSQR